MTVKKKTTAKKKPAAKKKTAAQKAAATKAAAKAKKSELRIAGPSHAILEVRIEGVGGGEQNSLIMESKLGAEYLKNLQGTSMDPTVKAGMLADRPGGKTTKAKNVPRSQEVLDQEFEYSLYRVAGKKNSYGLPASGFKKSMIELGKNKANDGIDGMHIKRNVWVMADCMSRFGEELVSIKCSTPKPQRDLGVNSGATPSPRVIYRSQIEKWEATLRVKFNLNAFEPEEILNMIARCGEEDGWGGKRLGKGHGHGGYRVSDKVEPKVKMLKFKPRKIKIV